MVATAAAAAAGSTMRLPRRWRLPSCGAVTLPASVCRLWPKPASVAAAAAAAWRTLRYRPHTKGAPRLVGQGYCFLWAGAQHHFGVSSRLSSALVSYRGCCLAASRSAAETLFCAKKSVSTTEGGKHTCVCTLHVHLSAPAASSQTGSSCWAPRNSQGKAVSK